MTNLLVVHGQNESNLGGIETIRLRPKDCLASALQHVTACHPLVSKFYWK